MTVNEIRELFEITYPKNINKDNAESYIIEHKVNDNFIIVTMPVGFGLSKKYLAKADYTYVDFDGSVNLLVTDLDNFNGELVEVPSNFTKASHEGGTILFDTIKFMSDEVLNYLIKISSRENDDTYNFSNIHPDFKIIGIIGGI